MAEKDEGIVVALHNMRDIWIDAWARAAVQITGSEPWRRAGKLGAQPGLWAGILGRRVIDAATAQLYAQLNLPSRSDVVAVSARLTRIETVLDDLGAALDEAAARGAKSAEQRPLRAVPQ